MTSANACRPRLVGRPRGIMPAPTASGLRAWGLLASLQGHEPRSTTARSAHLSLGFIDGRAAASPPPFRPANENARTINAANSLASFPPRRRDRHVVAARVSRRFARHPFAVPANLTSIVHVTARASPRTSRRFAKPPFGRFLFPLFSLATLKF